MRDEILDNLQSYTTRSSVQFSWSAVLENDMAIIIIIIIIIIVLITS